MQPPPPALPRIVYTFDSGDDGFTNTGASYFYRWELNSGSTPTSSTGPSSGSGGSGSYFFTETSSVPSGTEFVLTKTDLCPTGQELSA